MGLNVNSVQLLIKSKQLGADFDKTITIGRQGLHLTKKLLQNVLTKAGFSDNEYYKPCLESTYAEPFLKILGADSIDSIDASDYEGATIIHDLNKPIGKDLKSKYTLVIDGGSLEHIFNFPEAIKNSMEMLELGGHYIGITPANNFCGHGFYQFSPEIYFRIFNKSNGFELLKMYFFIDDRSGNANFYEITDPLIARERVTLINSKRSYLFVIAKRTEFSEIFKTIPQQSDYEQLSWKRDEKNSPEAEEKPIKFNWIKKMLPGSVKLKLYKRKRRVVKLYNRLFSDTGDSNPSYFKKVDKLFNNKK